MKINLKNKIMLTVLAGGMLYANGALAGISWYGTTGGFVDDKPNPAVTTGINLTIENPTCVNETYVYELTTSDRIYGGYSETSGVTVTGNSITLDTAAVINASICGGYSHSSNATNNTVTINGGSVATVYGGRTFSGNATNNTVTINDGSVTEVYGGSTISGSATNNTVTINGGSVTEVYGGSTDSGTSSNNTLNLKIKMGSKANIVKFFQIMNFTLPADIANGDTMLETANMTFDPTNTVINVDASAATLNDGDIITLIKADSTPTGVWTAGTVTGAEGTITLEGNNIIFTVTGGGGGGNITRNYEKEKAPVEGVAAGVAMVNQSADLASGEGMTSLLANTAGGGTDTYGAVTAGRSKYQTGSHVDMDGWGVLIGAGTTKNWSSGDKTTYGLFFEYGKGDFDTYNNDIHGEGDSKNEGVGIMARHTLKNNTYFDANIRYGKQETEWSESEIGGYDTDSRYYGAAVGLGHIYPLGKNEIDIYGRYSFGHTGACDAKVKDSDYHFDSVKSHRIRLGAKYNFVQEKSNAKPYVGLAWEHEFNGESKATITGAGEAPAPSLKGNTGIFEIGCDWDTGKWTLGAEANAYIGKRKGWGGMANAFYNF